jgi:hypothetical protein
MGHRWPVEFLASRGFALATLYAGDVDPDFDDGFGNGVHALEKGERDNTSGGTIAAWAWGLSRALDALQQVDGIDRERVIAVGHSRLGKTALWAAAQDERFFGAIANGSGCLGAALSRRRFGERIADITSRFPHWFCGRCFDYVDAEAELPIDQHMLLALLAPRPLYIASAADDLWADPRGEFLSCLHAQPAFELLGERGLGVDDLPPLNQSIGDRIGYHIRPGKHDLTPADWWHFMAFAERQLKQH